MKKLIWALAFIFVFFLGARWQKSKEVCHVRYLSNNVEVYSTPIGEMRIKRR